MQEKIRLFVRGNKRYEKFYRCYSDMANIRYILKCPITLELLSNPVLSEDGHTYEKRSIQRWIEENSTSSFTCW